MATLARELVRLKPHVIVAGAGRAALALKVIASKLAQA
jgi:D-arabinose 5-phosphate isomerase GutQ